MGHNWPAVLSPLNGGVDQLETFDGICKKADFWSHAFSVSADFATGCSVLCALTRLPKERSQRASQQAISRRNLRRRFVPRLSQQRTDKIPNSFNDTIEPASRGDHHRNSPTNREEPGRRR